MSNNWGAVVALREKRKLIGSFVYDRAMSIETAIESAKRLPAGAAEAEALLDEAMSCAKAIRDFLSEFP